MRVVVAGAGEVGRYLAGLLSARGASVVLVDSDGDALAAAGAELDVMTLLGDISHRSVLRKAEVARADGFLAVSGSDTANILGAAIAKAHGAGVTVARADDPEIYATRAPVEHGLIGVDHILCATRLAAAELGCRLDRTEDPLAEGYADQRVRVALWEVGESAPAVGRGGADLALPDGSVAAGVVRDGYLRRPEEIVRLEPGDRVLVSGTARALAEGRPRVARPPKSRRVLVAGGGRVGAQVARGLSGRGLRVELVDIDPKRCQGLAAELHGIDVLTGDATHARFLTDIQVETVDAVLACTGQDEVNLVTSLLVRQLSARHATTAHTFLVAHRPGFVRLCQDLGIEGAVSTFEVLARAAVEAITPAGGLLGKRPVPGSTAELVEVRLGAGGPLRRPLDVADLPLPTGARVLALARADSAIVPTPSTRVEAGDVLVLACPARETARLERALRPLARGAE